MRAYFEANRSTYDIDPHITFTHVFYNAERRGGEEAIRLAREKLPELNETGVPFEEASSHGDRFPYFVNYVERPPQLIASHLGGEVADALLVQQSLDQGHQDLLRVLKCLLVGW